MTQPPSLAGEKYKGEVTESSPDNLTVARSHEPTDLGMP